MHSLTARRAAAALAAAVALAVLGTAPVGARTDVSLDPNASASPIEIRGDALPSGGGAGVTFENHANVPATSVDLTWVFIDANGAAIAEQRTSERGRFRPGQPAPARVRFAGYTSGSAAYVADPDTKAYVPVEHISVVVDGATFTDGSAWQGKAREALAPPPEGFSDETAAAARIRVLRIQTTRSADPYDRVETRLSFASDNTKRIDEIQFVYTFYDLYGDVIFRNTSLVRGVYPRGAISTLNPMTRVNYRGVVLNRGSVWYGWGPDSEYVSKIGVGVSAVRYTDGTTWSAAS